MWYFHGYRWNIYKLWKNQSTITKYEKIHNGTWNGATVICFVLTWPDILIYVYINISVGKLKNIQNYVCLYFKTNFHVIHYNKLTKKIKNTVFVQWNRI